MIIDLSWAIEEWRTFEGDVRFSQSRDDLDRAKRARSVRRRAAGLTRAEYRFWIAVAERELTKERAA